MSYVDILFLRVILSCMYKGVGWLEKEINENWCKTYYKLSSVCSQQQNGVKFGEDGHWIRTPTIADCII